MNPISTDREMTVGLIKRYPLLSYFVLAYGLFWVVWIPLTPILQNLATFEVPLWALLLALLGIYAPTWAALIVTAVTDGRPGVGRLLAPLTNWKIGVGWYAIIIGLPMLLALIAIVIDLSWRGDGTLVFSGRWLAGIVPLLPAIPVAILTKLPLGPMAEELGWRGYALPRLQQKMTALSASLILGVVWALWHLPAFWVPGAALGVGELPGWMVIIRYVLSVTGVTVIMTWIYNHTHGSLLAAILFHAAYNALPGLLFAVSGVMPTAFTWVIWLCAALLVWRYGALNLGASRVTGYEPSPEPVARHSAQIL